MQMPRPTMGPSSSASRKARRTARSVSSFSPQYTRNFRTRVLPTTEANAVPIGGYAAPRQTLRLCGEFSGEKKLERAMSGFGGRLRPRRGCLAIRDEPAVDNWQDVKGERGRGDEPADHYGGERALHLRARTM